MKQILDTITSLTKSGGIQTLYAYYTEGVQLFSMFISDIVSSSNGVDYKEGELVAEIKDYDDISVFVNNYGDLIIQSDDDKTFSINNDGELIMEITE